MEEKSGLHPKKEKALHFILLLKNKGSILPIAIIQNLFIKLHTVVFKLFTLEII